MDADALIQYHLHELEMARNPDLPGYVAPPFAADDQAILDVGCGIGQSFIATNPGQGKLLVGIDIDATGPRYGRAHFGHIAYVNASAERLPFAEGSFDRVISRVSLPYTDIPLALNEMSRVLRDGGAVWLTLHSFSGSLRHFRAAASRFRPKAIALRAFVIANGILFHCFGRVVRMPGVGICESCQTESAMVRALRRAGFEKIVVDHGHQFVISGTRAPRQR